jgi:ABC-type transport system substrate-binding protein
MQFNAAGDPDKFSFLFWHSSQAGRSNLASFKNEEVDGLIERGRKEGDQKERVKTYKRIHGLIAEDRPAVFLFFRRLFIGASSRFEGIQADPLVLYRSIKDWKVFEKK